VERLIKLAMVGFFLVAVGMLMVAWKHHLYLAVFFGAASTLSILGAGWCLLEKERVPAMGFFDLGFLFGSVAGILVALHHRWIVESIIGGAGLICLFIALVFVELHPEDTGERG